MFDNLVESTSNKAEASRTGGFLAGTFVIYGLLIAAIAIGSIVWYDNSLDAENLELLTELDTPIQTMVEPEPEQPRDTPKPTTTTEQQVDVRTELVASTNEPTVVPQKVENVASNVPSRRVNVPTVIGSSNQMAAQSSGPVGPPGLGSGGPAGPPPPAAAPIAAAPPPPPPKPTPTPAPKPTAPRSGGVLNGKATSLPQPAYPANAKAVRAAGTVAVQVLVDESGRVASATATSGHPLLRAAAVAAARNAKFSPTLLSGQPVKVTGVINYNFTLQ